MTPNHLIEGPVRLGTAKCQHLVAVALIPPGPRTLAPYVTHALGGRCKPPTAQRIAPATALAVGCAASGLIKRSPTMGKSLSRVVCLRLQTFPAPQDHAPWAQGKAGHGRFEPLAGRPRCVIVACGAPLAVLGTGGSIAPLTGWGTERWARLPSPRGPGTDDAPAPRLCRHHTGLLDLLVGLAPLRRVLPLRPTAPMDDARPLSQSPTPALRITPLAAPYCPLGPMAAWPGTAPPGPRRPCGASGPVQAQPPDRTAPAARAPRRATPRALGARGRALQDGQARRRGLGERGPALAAHAHARQSAQHPRGLVLGPCGHPRGARLLPREWGTPRRHASDRSEGRETYAAIRTIDIGPRSLAHPPPRVSPVRWTGPRAVKSRAPWGQRRCSGGGALPWAGATRT
jgi:hypothetical protein